MAAHPGNEYSRDALASMCITSPYPNPWPAHNLFLFSSRSFRSHPPLVREMISKFPQDVPHALELASSADLTEIIPILT